MTLSHAPGRVGARSAVARGRPRRPGRDPRAGLPRHRRRPVRRDQLDRHVRARRRWRKLDEYFGRLYALLRPSGRLLNHGISRPPSRGDQRAFSRPRLHRPLRVPRRRAARGRHASCRAMQQAGLRGAPRREPARALRADAAALGREPRGELGRRRARWSARAGPGCGGSTWPRRRSTSRTTRTQIHQVLAVRNARRRHERHAPPPRLASRDWYADAG